MKTILPMLLLATGAAPGHLAARCTGSEVVQVGTQPPRTLPYTLTFSADLSHRVYCYDRCAKEQTYPIAAIGDDRLTLADVAVGTSQRHLTYDRARRVLEDEQAIALGPMRVLRRASGQCTPAPYTQPPLAAR